MPFMPGMRTSSSATSGWHSTMPRERLLAVGGLAHDLEGGVLGDEARDARAVPVVVVGDEHAARQRRRSRNR